MKKVILILMLSLVMADKNNSIGIGVGMGSSLIGIEYERRFGHGSITVGAGFLGFNAMLNLHLQKSINSSYISFGYWNQGMFGEYLVQKILGPSFTYRHRKIWQGTLGIGYILERGPILDEINSNKVPISAIFSFGLYLGF